MVVAHFLRDPEAQAHAQDIPAPGARTGLDMGRLSAAQRKLFDDPPTRASLPGEPDLSNVLLEPHPSWMTGIADEWRKRCAH